MPKSNISIVKNIEDHSPIYIFFRTKAGDTLAEVNRKNEIISTNWIFNIDKRLPLRLVIPEIIKLQEKKRNEVAHKNETAQNYYSYADSIGKNLAFIPFTNVYYKMEKPITHPFIFFDKNNQIWVNGLMIQKDEFENFLKEFENKVNFLLCFSMELNYESYIQDIIILESLKIRIDSKQEYIY